MGRSDLTAGSIVAGASSIMIWAFVPLKPNELTPARLVRSPLGHGVSSVGTLRERSRQLT